MGTICVSKSHYLDKIDVLQQGVIIEGDEDDPEISIHIPQMTLPKRSTLKGSPNREERQPLEEVKKDPVINFPTPDPKNPHDMEEEQEVPYGQVSAKKVLIRGSWLGNVSGSLLIGSDEFRRNTQIFMTVFEDTNVRFLLEQQELDRLNRNAKILIFQMENNGEANENRVFKEENLYWSSSLSMSSCVVETKELKKYEYPYIIMCSQTRCEEGGYVLHVEAENEVVVKIPRNFCEIFDTPTRYTLEIDGEWTTNTSGGSPQSLNFERKYFKSIAERMREQESEKRRKQKDQQAKFRKRTQNTNPALKLDLSGMNKKGKKEERRAISHKSEEVIRIGEESEDYEIVYDDDDDGTLDTKKKWLNNPQIPLITKEYSRCHVTLERTCSQPLTMGIVVLKPLPPSERDGTGRNLTEDNYEDDDDYSEEYSSEDDDEIEEYERRGKRGSGSRLKKENGETNDELDDTKSTDSNNTRNENQYYRKIEILPDDVVAQCEKLTCEKKLSFRCFLLPSDQPYIFVPFLESPDMVGRYKLTIRSDQPIHRQHYDKVEKWHFQDGIWMERTCGGRPNNQETAFFNCPQFFLRIKMSEDSPWINRDENKSIPAFLTIEQIVHGQDHMCIGFVMLIGGHRYTKKNWDESKIVVDRFPQYKQVLSYNLRLMEGEDYTIIPYPMLSNYSHDYKIRVGIKTHLPSDTDVHFVPAPENSNLFIDMDDFEVTSLKGHWSTLTSGGDDLVKDAIFFNNPQYFVSTGSKTKINVSLKLRESSSSSKKNSTQDQQQHQLHVPEEEKMQKKRKIPPNEQQQVDDAMMKKKKEGEGSEHEEEEEDGSFKPFPMGIYIVRVFHGSTENRLSYLQNIVYQIEKEEYQQFLPDPYDDAALDSPTQMDSQKRPNELVAQIDFTESLHQQVKAYEKYVQRRDVAKRNKEVNEEMKKKADRERRRLQRQGRAGRRDRGHPKQSSHSSGHSSSFVALPVENVVLEKPEITKNVVLPSGDYIFMVVTRNRGDESRFTLTLRTHKRLRVFSQLPSRPKHRMKLRGGFIGGRNFLNIDSTNIAEFIERNPSYQFVVKPQTIDTRRRQHICVVVDFLSQELVQSRICLFKTTSKKKKKKKTKQLKLEKGDDEKYEIIELTKTCKKRSYIVSTTLSPGEYRIVLGIEEGKEGQFEVKIMNCVAGPSLSCPKEIPVSDLRHISCFPVGSGIHDFFPLESLSHNYSFPVEFSGIVGPLRSFKDMKFMNPHYILETKEKLYGSQSRRKLRIHLELMKLSKHVRKIGVRIVKTSRIYQKSGTFDPSKEHVIMDTHLQTFGVGGTLKRRFCITPKDFPKSADEKIVLEIYPSVVGDSGKLRGTIHTNMEMSISKVGHDQKTINVEASWYSPFPKSTCPTSKSFIHNPVYYLDVKKTEKDEKNGVDHCSICLDLFTSTQYKHMVSPSVSSSSSSSNSTSTSTTTSKGSLKRRKSKKLEKISDGPLFGFFPKCVKLGKARSEISLFSDPKVAIYLITPSSDSESLEGRIEGGLSGQDFLGDGLKTRLLPRRYTMHLNIPFSDEPYPIVLGGLGVDLRSHFVLQVHHRGGSIRLIPKDTSIERFPTISRFEKIMSESCLWNIFACGDPFNTSPSNTKRYRWMNSEYLRITNPEPQWVRFEVKEECERGLMALAVFPGDKTSLTNKEWSPDLLKNPILACSKSSHTRSLVKTIFLPQGTSYFFPICLENRMGEFVAAVKSERLLEVRRCGKDKRMMMAKGMGPSSGRRTGRRRGRNDGGGRRSSRSSKEVIERESSSSEESSDFPVRKNDADGKIVKFQSGWSFGTAGGTREDKGWYEENPYLGIWSEKEQEVDIVIISKYLAFMKVYLYELDPESSRKEKGDKMKFVRGFFDHRKLNKPIEVPLSYKGGMTLTLSSQRAYRIVFSVLPKGTDGKFKGYICGFEGKAFHVTHLRRVLLLNYLGKEDQTYSVLLRGYWDRNSYSGVRGTIQTWRNNNPSILFSTEKKKPTLFEITITHNTKYFQTVSLILLDKKSGKVLYQPPFLPYQTKCYYRFITEGPSSYELIPILETDVPETEKGVGDGKDMGKSSRKKRVSGGGGSYRDNKTMSYPYLVCIQTSEEVYIESDMSNVPETVQNPVRPPFEFIDDEIWEILNNVQVLTTSGNSVLHKSLPSEKELKHMEEGVKKKEEMSKMQEESGDKDNEGGEDDENSSIGSARSMRSSVSSYFGNVDEKFKRVSEHLALTRLREAGAPLLVYGPKASTLVNGVSSLHKMYEFSDTKGFNEMLKTDKFGNSSASGIGLLDIPVPYIAAGEMGKGRVIVIGDEGLFHLDHVNKTDNRTFLLNCVEYVVNQSMSRNVDLGAVPRGRRRRSHGSYDDLQKLAKHTHNPMHPASPRKHHHTILLCYANNHSGIPGDILKSTDTRIKWISNFDKDLESGDQYIQPVVHQEDGSHTPNQGTIVQKLGAMILIFEENEMLSQHEADLIRKQITEFGTGAIILSKCSQKGGNLGMDGWVFPANYILKDMGVQISSFGDVVSNATHEHDELWWLNERIVKTRAKPHRQIRSECHFETINVDRPDLYEEISHVAACNSMFAFHCSKPKRVKSNSLSQIGFVIESACYEVPIDDKLILPLLLENYSKPGIGFHQRFGLPYYDQLGRFAVALNTNIMKNYHSIPGMKLPLYIDSDKTWEYFLEMSKKTDGKEIPKERHPFRIENFASRGKDWFCVNTSVYSRCGEEVVVEISNFETFSKTFDAWIVIGTKLPELQYCREASMKRFPTKHIRRLVTQAKMKVANFFGGFVYIECRKKKKMIGGLMHCNSVNKFYLHGKEDPMTPSPDEVVMINEKKKISREVETEEENEGEDEEEDQVEEDKEGPGGKDRPPKSKGTRAFLSWDGQIIGGVLSPKYELGKTSEDEWLEKIRNPERLPAPSFEWEGKKIVIVCPISHGVLVPDPKNVLEFWDSCVENLETFCGTQFETKPVVHFSQMSTLFSDVHGMACGAGTGQQVVAMNDYVFWSLIIYRQRPWLLIHELAFLLHRGQDYVWKGRMNALCHISSLYVLEKVLRLDFTQHLRNYRLRKQILLQFLGMDRVSSNLTSSSKSTSVGGGSGPGIDGSKIPWRVKTTKYKRSVQLSTFFELFFVENFGWEVYTTLFRKFRRRKKRRKKDLYIRNLEKIGNWVLEFSNGVGKNISLVMEAMGFLVRQNTKNDISNLRKWIPVLEE